MQLHLFTYGSLMIPEIMRRVSGADFESREATLDGYARYQLRGEKYPGLIAEEGTSTHGIVYLHLSEAAIERLDRFEGDWYDRITVEIMTVDQKLLTAETYVLHPDAHPHLIREPWQLENFRISGMQQFLDDYKGFDAIDI